MTADIIELALQYGRYGYRRITAMLRSAGWRVNKKRVERIWRCEGLKVPVKQPKRGRLWLNDGSCIRLRPQRPNHVWSYDFVADRTHDGKVIRMLCIIDEFTRESLAIRVARKLKATDVIEALCDLFVSCGVPAHIRSDIRHVSTVHPAGWPHVGDKQINASIDCNILRPVGPSLAPITM